MNLKDINKKIKSLEVQIEKELGFYETYVLECELNGLIRLKKKLIDLKK